ncbi:MAG: chloride channel protein [Halioglobus sp.]|nr:chloride channel protein [Halioglobus sp.]
MKGGNLDLDACAALERDLIERPWRATFNAAAWWRYFVLSVAATLAGSGALFFVFTERWSYVVKDVLTGKQSLLGWTATGFWPQVLPALWVVFIFVLVMRLRDQYFRGTQGTGIPQVMASLDLPADSAVRRKMLSGRILVGKVLLLFLVIIGGVTVGREGPSVHVAACIFFLAMRWATFPRNLVERGLIVSGGAAGIAAAFNTPIAAIIFAIEEVSRSFIKKDAAVMGVIVAIASIVCVIVLGEYYFYGHIPAEFDTLWDWWVIFPIAAVGGLAGGLFALAVLHGSMWIDRLNRRSPWRVAFGLGITVAFLGLISGGLSYGSGFLEAHAILHQTETMPWYYAVTKAAASGVALISGVPGGLFDPSLAVGAGLGQLTAELLQIDNVVPLVMAFMVAYFAGVVQSPITAFVIVVEMTGAHAMVLPLCVTGMIAYGCSRLVCQQGLYVSLSKLFLGDMEAEQAREDRDAQEKSADQVSRQ